ncbi:phytanoyl-CoA dioxygenase family protein [Pseudoalteromonas aurantia]|uniref:Phytanoyl-CoA dioxygenase n=1 Tax=Pseudoalteromonas aurantia TaxID=43654 RepID=A0A5S3VBC8_9GAMM|nr:phytanoyl-CoA dioxygenase family protein [Pseudoalteromonas aurantia]TMO69075.1 hypothetical protein CWC19_06470 [Pseudoalteromonas aurantia]
MNSKFKQTGFHLFKGNQININLIKKANESVAEIIKGKTDTGIHHWGLVNGENTKLTRIAQPHLCATSFQELLSKSRIGNQIASILGVKKVNVWGCQLYIKPPGNSSLLNVGWHRDSQHMPFFKSGVATLWIPLSKAPPESGSITYVPNSHDFNKYGIVSGANQQNMFVDKQKHSQLFNSSWQEFSLDLEVGEFSMHHWDLIHGSYENTSTVTRTALSVGIFTEDLIVDDTKPNYGYKEILNNSFFCPSLMANPYE